ncbi:MAG: zf-HC2 domain-containing protein [Myxococcota bacterium]
MAREQLHAYAQGEVDPARRAAIERHLVVCDECSAHLRQVQGLTDLLGAMGGADIDDLRWRRIRESVRAQLERDAQRPSTADIMSGRRWVLPAIPAAVAVAFLVWVTVGPQAASNVSVSPVVPLAKPVSSAHQLVSGASPLTVTLASGTRLDLEPRTQLQTVDSQETEPEPRLALKLEMGSVRVRTPWMPSSSNAPVLRTPAFELLAQSNDFLAGYWADKHFIDVRSGSVQVTGENFVSGTIISAGERREVRSNPPETKSVSRLSRGSRLSPPTRSESKRSKTVGNPAAADETTVVSRSESGAVTVDVELPEDPSVALWQQAVDAYYRKRDLSEAINLAEQVSAMQGPYAGQARQLICDAQIALEQGPDALKACERLLSDVLSDEERRNIHYTIGTIYRGLIGDCRNAIAHYNRALVFGRMHFLDDEVRMARAGCALEVGNIALAKSDIESLSARAGHLARPGEVTVLQKKLTEAIKNLEESSGRTD